MIQATKRLFALSLATLLTLPLLAPAEDMQEATSNAHFQTTYIW